MPSHVGQVIMSTTLDTAAKVKAIYGGTWEAWGAGRVPVGVNTSDTDFNAPNKTGGSKTVTMPYMVGFDEYYGALCPKNIRAYDYTTNSYSTPVRDGELTGTTNNSVTTSSKDLSSHYAYKTTGKTTGSVVQPYIAVYMWRRTA